MSVDHVVFVRDDRLPTLEQWQAALARADSGIVLEKIDDLRAHTGYLPASHRGHDSGFEWYYGTIDEWFDGDPPEGLGDRQHVATFVTHSDMREFVCGMVAGAVLAQVSIGMVYDEDSDELIDAHAALEIARGTEKKIQS